MLHHSDAEDLAAFPLFAPLLKRDLRRLARSVETLVLDWGETLQQQGARARHFYGVLDGSVAVTVDDQPIGYLVSGQWADATALLQRRPSPVGLVTDARSRVICMGERHFTAALDTMPGLARRLLRASVHAA